MRLSRALLLLTTALATPAMAADLGRAPPAQAASVSWSWTGPYVGLTAGYAWGAGVENAIGPVVADGIPTSFSVSPKGWLAGGFGGFNYQLGAVVVGVEADLSWSDLRGSSTWDAHIVNIPAASYITLDQSLDWLGTVRGRVGVNPFGGLLVYGTGGFAYGGVTVDRHYRFPPIDLASSDTTTRTGWAAGVGLEYALTPGWSVRGEWLHVDLDRLTADIGRGGVAYKF